MSGFEIILSQRFSLSEISQCIEKCYELNPGDVFSFYGDPDFVLPDSVKVFVRTKDVLGDFIQLLEIFVREEKICNENAVLASIICRHLKCAALISNQGLNPYSWIFVDSDGKISGEVFVDRENFDDGNFYLSKTGVVSTGH